MATSTPAGSVVSRSETDISIHNCWSRRVVRCHGQRAPRPGNRRRHTRRDRSAAAPRPKRWCGPSAGEPPRRRHCHTPAAIAATVSSPMTETTGRRANAPRLARAGRLPRHDGRLDGGDGVVGGAEAIGGGLREAAIDQVRHAVRDGVVHVGQAGDAPGQDALDRADGAVGLERPAAGEHLVEHDAQREEVGAAVGALAPQLFRRHVAHRAHQRRRACRLRPAAPTGRAAWPGRSRGSSPGRRCRRRRSPA